MAGGLACHQTRSTSPVLPSQEVYELMARDSFVRFKKTQPWADLLKEVKW
jgi:hypothetical protein